MIIYLLIAEIWTKGSPRLTMTSNTSGTRMFLTNGFFRSLSISPVTSDQKWTKSHIRKIVRAVSRKSYSSLFFSIFHHKSLKIWNSRFFSKNLSRWISSLNSMQHIRKIVRADSEIILRIQNSMRASSRISP